MRYKVTFYQCGVEGFDPEFYLTKRKAERIAVEFLRSFTGALAHGHRYVGSIYRDGYAAIKDYSGASEASATVHTIEESSQ